MDVGIWILLLALVGINVNCSQDADCKGLDDSLGRIVRTFLTPQPGYPVSGGKMEATVEIESDYPLEAEWSVTENSGTERRIGTPGKEGTGPISTTVEKQNRNTKFTLRAVNPPSPDIDARLTVYFKHPCNDIEISGNILAWVSVSGEALPRAMNIPQRVLDLREASVGVVKAGVKFDSPKMTVDHGSFTAHYARVGGKLFRRGHIDSRKPPADAEWKGSMNNYKMPELNGEIVFTKNTNSSTIFEATVLKCLVTVDIPRMYDAGYMNTVNTYGRGWFEIGVYSDILLKHTSSPALIVENSFEQFKRLSQVFDADGARLMPFEDNPQFTLPQSFKCSAEFDGRNTHIAAARIYKRGGVTSYKILPVHTATSRPNSYSSASYIIDDLKAGETADYICSAAYKDVVGSEVFRAVKTSEVKITTPKMTEVVLNNDTFSQPYRFDCKAVGKPEPNITFYLLYGYDLDWPQSPQYFRWGNGDPLKQNKTITVEATPSGGSVNVDWEAFPVLPEAKFRIACYASNQFEGAVSFVDFKTGQDGDNSDEIVYGMNSYP